ncbi:hypothetical protein KAI78_02450 [bacterium]|nr:hypothetical protein [bacterium]
MSYRDIFLTLNSENVRYLVVGGLAVNLYGVPRMTFDLDLIVENKLENFQNLVNAFQKAGFAPRRPMALKDLLSPETIEKWITEKNLIDFCVYGKDKPFEEIDIVLSHNVDFNKEYSEKTEMESESIIIPIISTAGLIEMKKYSGRIQDLQDVKLLRKLGKQNNEK